ncbi:MAG: NUDIX hydrolase [Rhodospirillaceae bacterium]
MQREYPSRPWVGVGVVVWRDDHVLLIRRGAPPRRGQWGLPGGAQAVGETLFEAAIREVQEETGLSVTPTAIVTACDGISRDEDDRVHYHYTLIEVAATYDGNADPVAADDAVEACWVFLEDVGSYIEWDETLRVIMLSAEQRRG